MTKRPSFRKVLLHFLPYAILGFVIGRLISILDMLLPERYQWIGILIIPVIGLVVIIRSYLRLRTFQKFLHEIEEVDRHIDRSQKAKWN